MSNSFDELFDPASRAIRRRAQFHAFWDAEGKLVYQSLEGEATTLSPEGSIDTAAVLGQLHCGHFADEGVGGKCREPRCPNLSCKKCYTRCSQCFKGLCLEHLHQMEVQNALLLLCDRCYDTLKRKRRLQSIVACLMGPFVEQKEKKSP